VPAYIVEGGSLNGFTARAMTNAGWPVL